MRQTSPSLLGDHPDCDDLRAHFRAIEQDIMDDESRLDAIAARKRRDEIQRAHLQAELDARPSLEFPISFASPRGRGRLTRQEIADIGGEAAAAAAQARREMTRRRLSRRIAELDQEIAEADADERAIMPQLSNRRAMRGAMQGRMSALGCVGAWFRRE